MMNANQKRASISATLVFAELRQVTNGIEEARQYSILADDIQQDRCFLLPPHESISLAHRIRALDVEDADVEKHRKTTADKCCVLRSHSRAGAVHFFEFQSSLLRPRRLAAPSE
jgi:hypothetical protein